MFLQQLEEWNLPTLSLRKIDRDHFILPHQTHLGAYNYVIFTYKNNCLAKKLSEYLFKGKRLYAPKGNETHLYVRDLPGTADELYIYKLFSPFGVLDSVYITTGGDGAWAIAFVGRNATSQMLLASNESGCTMTILALHDRELEVLR